MAEHTSCPWCGGVLDEDGLCLHPPDLLCKCGHPITKHLLIFVRVGQRERDRCTLCPCRLYRQDARG